MTKIKLPDIDIDFLDRNQALNGLDCISAKTKAGAKHPSGVYFQNIPVDPLSGFAAFTQDRAEEFGYFKIDFLNNNIYDGIRDEAHLQKLLDQAPDWSLLDHEEIVQLLNHIHDHFDVVESIKPKSIEDLAVVIALIRPGKRYLVGKDRVTIDKEIWVNSNDDGYFFKRSHAIAFASSIVVQLNKMAEPEPKVLNKHVDKIPTGAVYCGRGSPYGNPFVMGKDGDRDQVCDRFEAEILPDLDVSALRGKDLVCFCSPRRCHCDGILIKANK